LNDARLTNSVDRLPDITYDVVVREKRKKFHTRVLLNGCIIKYDNPHNTRAEADAESISILTELSQQPECKKFIINRETAEPLELTEAQLAAL